MVQGAQSPEHLVVIGASAGGVEALSRLVAMLPIPFPAPVVIAQHLDPHRPSQLVNILGRQSTLPVQLIEDRAHLTPGVIFVVPADRHVEIEDGELRLSKDSMGRPKPSVDRLFRSAARVYGERLIAVVLTGSDSDGAAGAQEVKAAGGMVIIQNPATARFPSMPASLAPAIVDVEADLEHIGPFLHDLVTGVYLPPEPDHSLQRFLERVREQSGIDFSSYRMPTIRRRLQRRMAAVKTQHLAEYLRYVHSHPEEYQRLINSFLIKVTEFFRDPDLYTYLREQVLPELIAEAGKRGDELRFWSAGCATGQEAYSLAILVAEVLGDQLDRFNVRIFATDLDADAIEVARQGIYPASALENVPAELRERYFTPLDSMYHIGKRVRALTVFGQHDLGQRAPFPRIDLCVCRNVLIYFTGDLQTRALQLFTFSLRDGGILVLGKSESISPVAEYFHPVQPQLKVFRRQGERLLIPTARPATSMGTRLVRENRDGRRTANLGSRPAGRTLAEHRSRDDLARSLLELPVGVVVVNRRYDIQMLNGAAGHLLGLQDAAIGEDLIHQVRGMPTALLRAAVDAAFQPGAPRSSDLSGPGAPPLARIVEAETAAGERRYLQIACYPHDMAAFEEDEGHSVGDRVLVIVTDVTRAETERRAATEVHGEMERALAAATERMERLAEANRGLQEANQKLIMTNIELRSANEEATVSTEEAQAATEEVETLNEEMQASNEELETLNEEMQATVEELKTTNDELQARSAELQAQTAALEAQQRLSEAERARLVAIMNSLGDAVLVVDPTETIVLTNPAYESMFGDAGMAEASDAAGQPLPARSAPRARAARGESFAMQFTLSDVDGSRRWFEAYGEPVRVGDAAQWGVVVIRDITERSLRQLQEHFVATVSHGLQTPITVIRANLGLLATGAATHLDGEERTLLTTARQHAELLRGQIDDLLTANQLRAGTVQLEQVAVDLREVASKVLESLRVLFEQQQQQITADLPEPLPALIDTRRMEQVLLNVLANAHRHTPAGTHITVSGRRLGDTVELVVRDDGPGVPEADLEAIFQPFQRLEGRRQGSGLGLSIARTLVTLHGGNLWAERPADGGIAFHIALPAYTDGEGI